MNQDWVLFTRYYEDGSVGALMTDLQFKEEIPGPSTHWVAARVELRSPTDDGLISPDEINAFQNFDQALFDGLTEAGVKYVGRIVLAGSVTAYGYGTVKREKLADISEQLLGTHGYDLTWAQEEDLDYQRYMNELYPTHSEWRTIGDQHLIVALEDAGFDLSNPTTISHWTFLPTLDAAELFAEWAQENGFAMTGIDEPDDASEELWCVRLSHVDVPSLEFLGRKTILLDAKARELEGSYDGWEVGVEESNDDGEAVM